MATTSIEWTSTVNPDGSVSPGKVWNPVVGCDKVSAGCTNCYAIRTAYRLEHAFKQPEYQGTTRKLPDGSVNWTGKVVCLSERLEIPLRWKKPARIFVNSMSDLFHEDVPDEFIRRVFLTMAFCVRHTFQVLTKRPERMRDFVLDFGRDDDIVLPNVWLGVSVEDQHAADERIPLLLQTPAAVRWLSCEPLIGAVDLTRLRYDGVTNIDALRGEHGVFRPLQGRCEGINWVVAGGESGHNYRALNLDWARSLRDQCQAAGVAFHFKQIGGRTHAAGGRLLDGREWSEFPYATVTVLP